MPKVTVAVADCKHAVRDESNPRVENGDLELEVIMRDILGLPPDAGAIYVPKLQCRLLLADRDSRLEVRLEAFPDALSLHPSQRLFLRQFPGADGIH